MTTTTKKTTRRLAVLTGLAVVVLAAASCGDNDDSGDGNNQNQSPSPSPGPTGGAGQTIMVPTVTEPNLTPQQAQSIMMDDITQQCGGEACVELTIQESDPTSETCQFVDTEPPAGTEVPRGSTITIVAGTQPCTSPSPGATGSPSPGASPTPSPTASPSPSPSPSPTPSPTPTG